MLTFQSLLRRICRFAGAQMMKITKKMYRASAVFTTAMAVIMVITFTCSGFGGGGKNALTAMAETPGTVSDLIEPDAELEDTGIFTPEAKIQFGLTESVTDGQLLVGTILTKDILKNQEYVREVQTGLEEVKKMVLAEKADSAREKAIQEAEEARILAERTAEEERRNNAVISYTDEDYQVFLRIVQAEAGICDNRGKLLVANVIINRVKSGKFPNTITGVVYQQSQFSPVSNGSINTCKVTDQTINCVNRALAGEDISDGALYFMNRGASRSSAASWFDSRLTYLFSHGGHEFFK